MRLLIVAALGLAFAAPSSAFELLTGKWQVSLAFDAGSGSPSTYESEICVKEAKGEPLAKTLATLAPVRDCTVSNIKEDSEQLEYSLSCSLRNTAHAKFRLEGKTLKGEIRSSQMDMTLVTSVTGRPKRGLFTEAALCR